MKLLIQWVISVVAIAITVRIVPGISVQGEEWKGLAIAAVMLGLANLLIRPILTLITAPITAVTLGLFWFVVGAIVLAASSWLSLRFFGAGIVIDGILSAILGALHRRHHRGVGALPHARLIAAALSDAPGRLWCKWRRAKDGMVMGGVIGETLPLGLGIALNPSPIVVAILILGTVNTPRNGIAFAFGWISGLSVLLVLTSLLVQQQSTANPEVNTYHRLRGQDRIRVDFHPRRHLGIAPAASG